MFVSIRTYRVGSGSIDALTHRVDRDLADAFAQEPGFVAYQVVRTGARTVASITTFREREQAEASNELAAQCVADALADFEVERMGVIGGEVMVGRALADMLEPGHHWSQRHEMAHIVALVSDRVFGAELAAAAEAPATPSMLAWAGRAAPR